jgi:hypothetical protein
MSKREINPKTFALRSYVGEEVAITPFEKRPNIVCKKGTPEEYTADAYKATVRILTGPDAGSVVTETLLFGQAVVSRLDKAIERGDLPFVATPSYIESVSSGRTYLDLLT